MKRNSKIGITVLVLLLAVGFAAITTTLIINNSARIASNPADFDVYFSYAYCETDASCEISADRKSITYSTSVLKSIDDEAWLDYSVTNGSTNYDANVTVSWNATNVVNGTDYSSYYNVQRFYADKDFNLLDEESDSPFTIPASSWMYGDIDITLLKQPTEDVQIEFIITFDVEAVERTESVIKPDIPTIDTCPGCKYAYFDDNMFYLNNSLVPLEATTSYINILNEHLTWFGLVENETTGLIEKGYVCSVYNGTPFCLEAFNASNYDKNVEILDSIFTNCNLLDDIYICSNCSYVGIGSRSCPEDGIIVYLYPDGDVEIKGGRDSCKAYINRTYGICVTENVVK